MRQIWRLGSGDTYFMLHPKLGICFGVKLKGKKRLRWSRSRGLQVMVERRPNYYVDREA